MAANAMAQTITLNQIDHTINDGGNGIQANDTITFTFTVGGDEFNELTQVTVLTPGVTLSLSGPTTIFEGTPPNTIEITGIYTITSQDISNASVSLINVQAQGDYCGDGCITFSNSQNYFVPLPIPATFTVYPYFDDGNPGTVTIGISCDQATPDSASKQATINSPAVFTLNDVGVEDSCTATQNSGPSGYQSSNFNCSPVYVSPGGDEFCTIYNYYQEVSADVEFIRDAAEPSQDGAFKIELGGSPPYGGMYLSLIHI